MDEVQKIIQRLLTNKNPYELYFYCCLSYWKPSLIPKTIKKLGFKVRVIELNKEFYMFNVNNRQALLPKLKKLYPNMHFSMQECYDEVEISFIQWDYIKKITGDLLYRQGLCRQLSQGKLYYIQDYERQMNRQLRHKTKLKLKTYNYDDDFFI